MTDAPLHRISSGSPYEPLIGISRAARCGRIVAVSGTAPLGADGKTLGIRDVGAQARRCLEIIRDAVHGLGGQMSDVVRTRVYLTRIEDWKTVAAVHGEVFSRIRPACTFLQVAGFIDPDWLVEIEADAVLAEVD